ncbi:MULTISPECIES: MFS transporter [Paenibacillus]|uniref:MFS transporter n=1 Tax=Paenibacillus TaxID=44249 RepID=UPI0022B8E19B|nr:MFS transporter [Paenibacillus caseinilyticus]MCZ8522522.1 MFS transporter [Paenibacillus caseinilyticus]
MKTLRPIKNKELAIVLAIVSIFFMCTNMYPSFVPILITQWGGNYNSVGIIMTIASLAPLLTAIPAGFAVKKWGLRVPLFVSSMISALSCFMLFLFPSIIQLVIMLSVLKVAEIFFTVGLQTKVANLSNKLNNDMDKNYSWFMVYASVGSLIGPIVGGFLVDYRSYNMIWIFLSIILVGLSFFSLYLHDEKNESKDNSSKPKLSMQDIKKVLNWRISIGILVGSGVLFAHGARFLFLPIYLQNIGYTLTTIGFIMAARSLAAIASRSILELVIKICRGRSGALVLCSIVLAISIAIIPISSNFTLQLINSVIIGLAMGIAIPLSNTVVADSADPEERSVTIGISQTVNRIGQLLSPVVFGVFSQNLGVNSSFYLGGTLLFIISLLVSYLLMMGSNKILIEKQRGVKS